MDEKSKVYILINERNCVARIEGGYTTPADLAEWIYIDEGDGDKYNLCQTHYLPDNLTDDRGIYQYKFIDGEIVKRTQAEIDADYIPISEPQSNDERIAQLERAIELLLSGAIE